MTLEKRPYVVKTFVFFANLIIALLYGCVTKENVIANLVGYKKGLYALYTMINAQLFISCLRKSNQ